MRELNTAKVGAYIEIVTPELSAPPLMKAIHENL
jgi:indolepyruvate decarboxylase